MTKKSELREMTAAQEQYISGLLEDAELITNLEAKCRMRGDILGKLVELEEWGFDTSKYYERYKQVFLPRGGRYDEPTGRTYTG